MALYEVAGMLRRVFGWRPARRRAWSVGRAEVDDARRLADAERAAGGVPEGCAWLDERTVGDLDLPLVFRAIDRSATPLGAQALWRWLVAPAVRLEVLAARERELARLAGQPGLRDRIRGELAGQPASDAPLLPRLLWEPGPRPLPMAGFTALAATLVALIVAGVLWWPPLLIAGLLVFVGNLVVDDWASLRLAHHGRALQVLVRALGQTARVLDRCGIRDEAIARDLAVFAGLRKRVQWLTFRDPFDLAELLRAGLLARVLLLGRFLREVTRERDRLRRVVLWLGELDALVSIASLRAERTDARLPELASTTRQLAARDIVHPAIAGAVGNELSLEAGLLVTGSNMSGKSTFLRAIAINAVLAQSIHTTFGTWRASLFRVFAVMRVADATAEGMSTYAVEVAAIGALVDAVSRRDRELRRYS
jgi:hypothetical protein